MKKTVQLFLSIIALGICSLQGTQAQTLIHYWHFNNIDTGGVHVNNLAADYSTIGSATIVNQAVPGAGADTGYVDSYAPGDTTLNVHMSADPVGGQHQAMRLRNPNDSMECLWYIPSTHYKNIVLKFATQKSNNGPGSQNYQYSVDSGATWRTAGLDVTSYQPAANTWTLVTINMSTTTDTMIKNNPKLVFRLTMGVPNTGTSGNNRFDNISVEGDTIIPTSVPEIAATNQFSIYPNPATGNITVTCQVEDAKNISIYNVSGQEVYTAKCSGKNTILNISSLNAGIYYVTVTSAKGLTSGKLKFVKE